MVVVLIVFCAGKVHTRFGVWFLSFLERSGYVVSERWSWLPPFSCLPELLTDETELEEKKLLLELLS